MKPRCMVAVLAGVALAGCAGEDEVPDHLSVVSFNAGLAFGYVPEASARVGPIVDAISQLDADVVCMQELWVEQDAEGNWTSNTIEQVVAGTAAAFPSSYWSRTTAPEGTEPVGCTIEEAEPLEACAVANCGDVPPENLADCVLADCVAEFMGTSAGCQSCMASNLGQPLDAIIAACKGVSQSGIVFDGHNGLAILSRFPLKSSEIRDLDYALTARAILHGGIELDNGHTVDVLCTHLAADLQDSIDYPEGGSYGSFGEENRAQADAMIGFADELGRDRVVLVGDFNHGPAAHGARAEFPDTYAAVIDAGFDDPIADSGAPCTFCDANLLVGGSGGSGKLIDHVYVPGGASVDAAAVILDQPLQVTGADGSPTMVNLSDHYGVRVEFSF